MSTQEKPNFSLLPVTPNTAASTYGSLDLCLSIEDSIEDAEKEIREKGGAIEEGLVTRHGTFGEMKSIYLRDPDGNLIELASYGK